MTTQKITDISESSFPPVEHTSTGPSPVPFSDQTEITEVAQEALASSEASTSRPISQQISANPWYATVFNRRPALFCAENPSKIFSNIQSGIPSEMPKALAEGYVGKLTTCLGGFRMAAYNAREALCKPIVVTCSSVIPPKFFASATNRMAETAMGRKFEDIENGLLTNGDAELRSYGLALVETMLRGDIVYERGAGLVCKPFGQNVARKVLLSTYIHPDFERHCSTLASFSLSTEQINPQDTCPDLLTAEVLLHSEDYGVRQSQVERHDREIKAYLAYQLNGGKPLPSKEECIRTAQSLTGGIENDLESLNEGSVLGDQNTVKGLLEALISDPSLTPEEIQEKVSRIYVQVGEEIFPALMLLNKYIKTLEAELTALETTCTQGYVYTFDPPSIFASLFGRNPTFLNRFQLLALKCINRKEGGLLKNMRAFAFNDFQDGDASSGALALLRKVDFPPRIAILKKTDLYATGNYVAPGGMEACALVLHNNSDGYGNNILNEVSKFSMDALFCCESTAGISLALGGFPANALGYDLQLEKTSEVDDCSRRIETVTPWSSQL